VDGHTVGDSPAYFLRVTPPDGAASMSPEVEAAALEALRVPDLGVVRDGIHVLQLYGSSRTNGHVAALRRHHRAGRKNRLTVRLPIF
jgi:hypothetical protein